MLLNSFFVTTLVCAHSLMAMRISLPQAVTTASVSFEESPISRLGYDSYAKQHEINTDLLAPEPSSLSKFYHEQPKEYQTQGYNPFLFLGHTGTDMVPEAEELIHQKEAKNIEKSTHKPERSSYHIFTPTNEGDVVDYDDMALPSEVQEPNYYSIKPQKTKKYSKSEEKKHTKKTKRSKKFQKAIVALDETEVDNSPAKDDVNIPFDLSSGYNIPLTDLDLNAGEVLISASLKNDSEIIRKGRHATSRSDSEETTDEEDGSVEPKSKDPTGTRVDFQMHGHNGPKSYKFGYDTGFGKNRQFRLEERDKEGNVYGQYGYINKKGALKIVKYTAGLDGFKVIQ